MKNRIILLALCLGSFYVVSCDYILKTKNESPKTDSEGIENIILAPNVDRYNCAESAGYYWSQINQNCMRVFETGFRLIPSDLSERASDDELDLSLLNAYLLFNADKTEAEVFLPSATESMVMQQVSENTYQHNQWELLTTNRFLLKKDGVLFYLSAVAEEGQIDPHEEYNDNEVK